PAPALRYDAATTLYPPNGASSQPEGAAPSAPLGGGVGEGIGIKANVLRLPSVSRPASPRRRRSAALQEWNSAREQSPSPGHGGDFVVDVAVGNAVFAERGASPAARRRPVRWAAALRAEERIGMLAVEINDHAVSLAAAVLRRHDRRVISHRPKRGALPMRGAGRLVSAWSHLG